MFKNVIVGVDEHEGGRDAITLAKELVDTDGRLTLAHVQPSATVGGRRVALPVGAQTREEELERLANARTQAGVDAQLVRRFSSSAGRGLHELAEEEGADLIVIGSCRRSLIGRVLIGDHTREALNGAPCAVAVAPAGYAGRPKLMREIGVGYDGSPESSHALDVARAIASRHGAQVTAFQAISLRSYLFSSDFEKVDESIDEAVAQTRKRIAELGDVEPHAAFGDAAEELALYGASVDLLVVGSRGYGPIGRLVHGSVSRQLARTARCPLLVLTRSAQLADDADPDRTVSVAGAEGS